MALAGCIAGANRASVRQTENGRETGHAAAWALRWWRSLFIPFALDGEAAVEHGGNGTAIAVVSAVSLRRRVLLLFALWRYVFSEKAKVEAREPPDPEV